MQWADETYDEKVPFWIYMLWMDEDSVIVDKEDKSLCYVPFGVGCLMPYAPTFKNNAPVYENPSTADNVVHRLTKDDIVFPLALTHDGQFYQVIIFPKMQPIQSAKSVEKATEYAEVSLKGTNPINAFVKKDVIKSLSPNNPLIMRLDSDYAV